MTAISYVIAAAAVWWVGMISSVVLGGLIFIILAAVLAALKFAGIFAWSWWWAMLPLWGAMGGASVKMWLAARDPNF